MWTRSRQQTIGTKLWLWVALAAFAVAPWTDALGQARRRPRAPEKEETSAVDSEQTEFAIRRLLKRATDLLSAGERDRGVKMLETILDRYPGSRLRFEVYLALGKYYMEANEQKKAVDWLRRCRKLEQPGQEMSQEEKDVFLEALYLTGVAYFQMKQYSSAFPILRKITKSYPNTVWANQAYYYVGMCHFASRNWRKAIDSLTLVGTFIDVSDDTVNLVEAGRRFYVKLEDADLPVQRRLGQEIRVAMETKRGDKVELDCIPLADKLGVYIASISTEVAPPKEKDDTLQVAGGDTITVKYLDKNTQTGDANILRSKTVKVVSTGAVSFTVGTYESEAAAAFLGQPSSVLLQDVDLDLTNQADTVVVKVIARYQVADETADEAAYPGAEAESRVRYRTRDEVLLTLKELGEGDVIHTGRFGGKVMVEEALPGETVNVNDQVLSATRNDEIVVTYVDDLHIGGDAPRQAQAKLVVAGRLDAIPVVSTVLVPDPVIRAKKQLVEGAAYLELSRIFADMGLTDRAKTKASEGLERVDEIIVMPEAIPSSLRQEAYQRKWELYIVQEEYPRAIQTCQLFHRLYPESPLVDQALMGIAKVKFESKVYREAMGVCQQVLRLEASLAKAEAQYLIARCVEATTSEGSESAIAQYKICASKYPDSEFAGPSLKKLVDYHIKSKDYSRASELLEQTFQDHPDADFLDSMLLKWVLVAYRMGEYAKALDKCNQLIFEYPDSAYAQTARKIKPRIEAKVASGTSPE